MPPVSNNRQLNTPLVVYSPIIIPIYIYTIYIYTLSNLIYFAVIQLCAQVFPSPAQANLYCRLSPFKCPLDSMFQLCCGLSGAPQLHRHLVQRGKGRTGKRLAIKRKF